MFSLTAHIAQHPIADDAYLRHLRTADVFNELREAASAHKDAAWAEHEAWKRLEAAKAKAALMQAMEDL